MFTFALLQVASAKFVKDNAPAGCLATLTGITGGAHFGFGKGVGGLVGGVIIEITKSTKTAFFYFSLVSFGCGGIYGIVVNIIRLSKKSSKTKTLKIEKEEEEEENTKPFLDSRGIGDGSREDKDDGVLKTTKQEE